ncbi:DUF4233 domain-containing protein [Nocardioides sp. Soil805]|uniref:DUF4233 domain-containing protein n=1 Tax=Nocardioides sp. Soil805 TaxID=1736416 RepID=UPI000AC9ACC6|nr:DUF4233 domain-containing protein [Nocardioides sp. Soil805]
MSDVSAPQGQAPQNTERSPRRGMCAAVLCLEAITVGLTTPVLITIADVSVGPAVLIGVGLAVACLLLAGMLRAPWAYTVGWVLQVAAVAIGFLVPLMFVLGGIFALLWGMADFLGRKIERERAAAWAAYRAEDPD